MQIHKHHVIFDEITYDREALKDWYKRVKHLRTDYAVFMNKQRESNPPSNLTHDKKFVTRREGEFDTIDTTKKPMLEYDIIRNLADRFNFDVPLKSYHIDVLIFDPNFSFRPHVDFHMHCGIMFPILPDTDVAPIDFYHMPPGGVWERAKGYDIKFNRDLDYSYSYSLKHPSLFNGDIIHGVRNNGQQRVFLRFKCLSMTFDQVVEKLKSGNFINPEK